LVSRGAALYASTEEEIAAASQRLLDRAPERERLLDCAESVRRPEAAADVAAIVRKMVEHELLSVSARGSR
jgi:hypothetical protein